MEIIFDKLRKDNKEFNFTIKNNEINGIYCLDSLILMKIMHFNKPIDGKIKINNKEITNDDLNEIKKKTSIVENNFRKYYQTRVYELMYYMIIEKNIILKNPKKKIVDSLKIVGLNSSYLDRQLCTLSSSEKKQIQFALALLSNPELIIMDEPFINYDLKTSKKMWMLIQRMKDQYNKTFIWISHDIDNLFKYSTNLIIIKNNKILIEGKTNEIIQKVEYLKKNKIPIPPIIDFTYQVKKEKNICLEYHNDVRDILKDIYKHV